MVSGYPIWNFQVVQKKKKDWSPRQDCQDNVTFHYVRVDNLKHIIVFISRISH